MIGIEERAAFIASVLKEVETQRADEINRTTLAEVESPSYGEHFADARLLAVYAVHESGHAVADEVWVPGSVHDVFIRPDGNGGQCSAKRFGNTFQGRIGEVISLLAGHVAGTKASTIDAVHLRESSDFVQARIGLDELARDFPEASFNSEAAAKLVVSIVDSRWPQILHLASHLLERYVLTGDAVREILREVSCDTTTQR